MKDISGEDLNFLGAALANQIAAGKDSDELSLLSALFNLVADALGVISAKRAIEESKSSNNNSASDNSSTNNSADNSDNGNNSDLKK